MQWNWMHRILWKECICIVEASSALYYPIAKESFVGGSFILAEMDYFESGEALCCSAWCFNCCTVCKQCLLVVIGEVSFISSGALYAQMHPSNTVCQQYIIIGNMCNVNYAYHLNETPRQNIINYHLPVSCSVIKPFLMCHNCSHCCIRRQVAQGNMYLFVYLLFLPSSISTTSRKFS